MMAKRSAAMPIGMLDELTKTELEAMRASFKDKDYLSKWRKILAERLSAIRADAMGDDAPAATERGRKKRRTPWEYFCTVPLKEYEAPMKALAREFLQNSWDAGCRRIDVSVGSGGVSVMDDGCGMTEDVLENKLLTTGGTYKGENATGGFGKAKELLYFCWPDFLIHTNGVLALGMQDDYVTIRLPKDLERKGTASRISLWDKASEEFARIYDGTEHERKCFGDEFAIRQGFSDTVARSFGRKPVYLDSERCRTAMRGKELFRRGDAALYKLGSKRSDYLTRVNVSVNGIHMFQSILYCAGGEYLLDFEGKSEGVLTCNRDGCYGEAKSMLEETRTFLTKNEEKLNEKKTRNVIHVYGNPKGFVTARGKKPREAERPAAPAEYAPIAATALSTGNAPDVVAVVPKGERAPVLENVRVDNKDFVCKDEDPSKGFDFWTVSVEKGMGAAARRFFGRPRVVRKFSRMAREMLSVCLAAAEEVQPDSTDNVAIGLVFSDLKTENGGGVKGSHMIKDGWPQIISLNPLLVEDALMGKTSMKGAAIRLLGTCLHETAHIFVRSHGEQFSSMYGELNDKMSYIAPDVVEEAIAAAEDDGKGKKEKIEQGSLLEVSPC